MSNTNQILDLALAEIVSLKKIKFPGRPTLASRGLKDPGPKVTSETDAAGNWTSDTSYKIPSGPYPKKPARQIHTSKRPVAGAQLNPKRSPKPPNAGGSWQEVKATKLEKAIVLKELIMKAEPALGSGERFKRLTSKLSGQSGVTDPKALAAAIGRKKYGKQKFQELAAAGRKKS